MAVKRFILWCAAALAAGWWPGAASAGCAIGKVAELPVTMEGMQPTTRVKIDGQDVRFLIDSGAFFSMISPGSARVLGLHPQALPNWILRGINGNASMSMVTVKTFTISGVDIPHVDFVVAGSEMGQTGVLGQNLLGLFDAEYDLPHGTVRLIKATGCHNANLAYWAGGRSVAVVDLARRDARNPHIVGTVYLNGARIRATFDTGAATSMLSMAAAARAGITPRSPGVRPGGIVTGFGRRLVRTWIAPFASFKVGEGEEIRNGRIRFGDMTADTDMLLGADFFIAHRIYVANSEHKILLTYEGGPVFDLKTEHQDESGRAVATPQPAASGPPPADPEALSRQGATALAQHDRAGAIADFGRAIALAPREPRYLVQRADAYLGGGEPAKARADLDAALALDPHDLDALLARAGLLVRNGDRVAAVADLEAASRAAPAAADQRIVIGGLFIEADAPAAAIPEFDQWIKAHPDDVRRPSALNGRCWAKALAGQDLPAALHDCDRALGARPGSPEVLDSRAMVELRMGRFDKALADYDAALAKAPDRAWSLYGRGIAKLRLGDAAGGRADLAAAAAKAPRLAQRAARLGITP